MVGDGIGVGSDGVWDSKEMELCSKNIKEWEGDCREISVGV